MKYTPIFLIAALLLLTTCASYRQQAAQARKQHPTFYIGEYSWNAMIFRDTILYGQSFSDGGGMLSDTYPMGNWRFINDSTVQCYNLKKKKGNATAQTYHLDRIDMLTQLLIPEQSQKRYQENLKTEVHAWLATPYQVAKEDEFLIQSDSARFYTMLLTEHRNRLIDKYKAKFNELGIYYGRGF